MLLHATGGGVEFKLESQMKRTLLSGALLLALPLAAQTGAVPGAGAAAPVPTAASAVAAGLAALHAGKSREALADFQQAIRADPSNAAANLYAATAALELYEGQLAVGYAEKARQLDPSDWKVDTTLVAAYAEAGMKQQRDALRARLRALHAAGTGEDAHARDARLANGFLLEMFPVESHGTAYQVDAVEYFEPMGEMRTYYRFLVRQADGRLVWEIDVESNNFDERSWAQAHSGEAAAGERQFQLIGHGESAQGREVDYRMFTGKPDYDAFRAMVVTILEQQPPAAPAQ